MFVYIYIYIYIYIYVYVHSPDKQYPSGTTCLNMKAGIADMAARSASFLSLSLSFYLCIYIYRSNVYIDIKIYRYPRNGEYGRTVSLLPDPGSAGPSGSHLHVWPRLHSCAILVKRLHLGSNCFGLTPTPHPPSG